MVVVVLIVVVVALFFAELSKSAKVVAVNTVEVGSHKYNCSDKVNLATIVKMSGSYQPHQ